MFETQMGGKYSRGRAALIPRNAVSPLSCALSMVSLRRHLRFWAAIWLVFQVATLSAFVPRDCCEAHRTATDKAKDCHEEPPATHCPMAGADGAACPMQRSEDAEPTGHHHHSQPVSSDCTMRGTCDGPMAAMFALFSNHGVLPDRVVLIVNDQIDVIAARPSEDLVSRLASPDPPPPRL